MTNFYDYYDVVKRYFSFSNEEFRALLITSIILAFSLSFRHWGVGNAFSLSFGLFNFFNYFVLTLLALLVNLSAKKLYALNIGYHVKYELWVFGLVFSILLVFITNGYLYFLAVGSFYMSMLRSHRLGYFRYGLNYFALGMVSFIGVLANISLAAFFRFFYFTNSPLLKEAVLVNLLVASFSMVPIPPLDGVKLFFASPFLYAFTVGLVVGAWVFIFTPSFWWFIFGILMFAFLGLYFIIKLENPFSVS